MSRPPERVQFGQARRPAGDIAGTETHHKAPSPARQNLGSKRLRRVQRGRAAMSVIAKPRDKLVTSGTGDRPLLAA